MNWFFIALGCAFSTACSDALSKRIMKECDEWTTGTIVLVIAWLLLVPFFPFMEFKPVSLDLLLLLAAALPLEILGYYLFLSALHMGSLSLTVPLLAFTPVFTVLTAAIMLGEGISGSGGIGIALVTAGAYFLNADLLRDNPVAPIKALFSNPGSRRMMLVALVWSVTSALGKKGVLIYGAIPFGVVLLGCIIIIFGTVSLARLRAGVSRVCFSGAMVGFFLLAGIFMAAAEVTHFVSMSMAPVAYMISVKRVSMVFGVILGKLFFHEANFRYRLFGASIIVSGVFFLYG